MSPPRDHIDLILDELSPNEPMTEEALLDKVCIRLTVDEAERAIADAHSSNVIRWVAFQGWCKGGRPE